ncbi:phenylalanine--tRNA ligase beta subunit-related protein [Sphingobium sp. Sx8-8]|uniref:B3/B4 domain-containing protein n=1 Tax=Sphingobium sp. Sx8-8 TaxID=2933617 RepID=UPI001F5ADBE6|nr:phenylalanine--tRNA ligase beta subunit-related protein [Sphingobium sp. Sx8-8]
MTIQPSIDPSITALGPGFRAVSLFLEASHSSIAPMATDILGEACAFVKAGGPTWADDHIKAWNDVFVRFGAKPGKTPSSAAALRKRVLKDGVIASISPVVDLYNAISLSFALPIGGEDVDAYIGNPRLTIADGSERFDTIISGEPMTEHPAPGEVIWRDDVGVTCRRWNWRQGLRTRIGPDTRRVWFVLESCLRCAKRLCSRRRTCWKTAYGACSLNP